MTCNYLCDENGNPIGFVCTRGSKVTPPDELKARLVCRRWCHCKDCKDHATCLEIAARLDAKKNNRSGG